MIEKPILYSWEHACLSHKQPQNKKHDLLQDAIEFVYFENDTDYAYLVVYDKLAVFSFRGTENLNGWLSNLDPYPLKNEEYIKKYLKDGKWGKGTIHDGFYTDWMFFKSCVTKVIESYHIDNENYEIYVCGYSRGGALAELCSRHLAKNLKLKNCCFTFGSPAVGNKKYRDQFRILPINGTRLINGWDMVPTLPPKLLGFRHGCTNKVWMKKLFWIKYLPWIRIKDHYMSSYDKAIKKRYK